MSAILVLALAVVAVNFAPSQTKIHTSASSVSSTTTLGNSSLNQGSTTSNNVVESSTTSTSLLESTTYVTSSTCSSVTSSAVTNTSSTVNGLAISLVIAQPVACFLTLSSATFVSNETFPLTVTSPQSTSVQLQALNVPQGVLVYFEPTEVTATPNGAAATMTIAGAVQPFTSGGADASMLVEAAAGNLSVSLNIQLIVAPLSIISSSLTPTTLHEFLTNENGPSYQTYGIVYGPAGAATYSPLPVSFSVTGMLVNGDVVALPSWFQLLNANFTFSLLPDQPIYFVMASNAISAPPGTYQLVVQENIDGASYSTVMSLIVVAPIGPVQLPSP